MSPRLASYPVCMCVCIVLYCVVSIHLYNASCSGHQSEALPVRETQREERSMYIVQQCVGMCACMYVCLFVCMYVYIPCRFRGQNCPAVASCMSQEATKKRGAQPLDAKVLPRPGQKFGSSFLLHAHRCSASGTTTSGTRACSKPGNSPKK